MKTSIHIGSLIKKLIDSRYLKRTDIARDMGVPNTAIYAYEKQDSLQTGNLLRICDALKYNFFMDIANRLPKEYESSKILISDKDQLLQQQADEIQKLKWENDLLKELITAKK